MGQTSARNKHRKSVKMRSVNERRWPGQESINSTPWGRCNAAFDRIIEHANADPAASVLLAAGTAPAFVNMHAACEHHLPQAGAWRVAGVWFFPNKSRLRIARTGDVSEIARISDRRFTLIATQAEAEAIMLLEPLLLPDGCMIPFLGNR